MDELLEELLDKLLVELLGELQLTKLAIRKLCAGSTWHNLGSAEPKMSKSSKQINKANNSIISIRKKCGLSLGHKAGDKHRETKPQQQ